MLVAVREVWECGFGGGREDPEDAEDPEDPAAGVPTCGAERDEATMHGGSVQERNE